MATRLSVNVNKIATLRNSRGKNLPDVYEVAKDIIHFGAHGITVHPRPDGRHIRRDDVHALAPLTRKLGVEFNIEGYPSEDFLALIEKIRPDQCTLVPDPPHVLTSNAGWKLVENRALLKTIITRLRKVHVRSSIFLDVFSFDENHQRALREIAPDRVELFTEAYADCYFTEKKEQVLEQYKNVAAIVRDLGIGVNAGHDLNLKNLGEFLGAIPWVDEVSIGHALVCDALYLGLKEAVACYCALLTGHKMSGRSARL